MTIFRFRSRPFIAPQRFLTWFVCVVAYVSLGLSQTAKDKKDAISYSRDVLPILSQNCFACHGYDAKARQADLRLDRVDAATENAISIGKPDESEMIARVLADDEDDVMPPPDSGERLEPEEIETLKQWIAEGAQYESHWAFQRPSQTELPIGDARHPIDRFVQSKLRARGLAPSKRANPEALLRRLSLDLVGLPPTVQELDQFLSAADDDFESAYLAEVDRLLKSPHYGERWGRWWLDQARYADSNGYSVDGPRQIWKFRDWVINALNEDLGFDEFTIEQLAGDLLPNASQSQKVATGFHRNTQINQEGGIDREQFRVDSVFDRVATTGTVWMGLTIGCAQCHDHKFDPISQEEYYQLFAFFNNQDEPNLQVHDDIETLPQRKANLEKANKALSDYLLPKKDSIRDWVDSLGNEKRKKLSRDTKRAADKEHAKRSSDDLERLYAHELGKKDQLFIKLRSERDERKKLTIGVPTMVMAERQKPRDTRLLIKGDFTRPDRSVTPAMPKVLHPAAKVERPLNRLDLARWIVQPENPLTARVIVNRVWQVYFGKGLVETENDFGTLGSLPSHPKLLDWMAVDWQENEWSLKYLHRLIVTSATYQQSSNYRDDLAAADPNNLLLGRQTRLRLEAELIRDVCLSASGLLSRKMGGPPVYPPIPSGVMNRGQVRRSWKASTGEDRFRRGLYTFVYRATPPPSLNVFDAPDGYSTCTRRPRSNTPLQALTLLNDQSFLEFADALKQRLDSEGIERVFRSCTSRKPNKNEIALLKELDSTSVARVLLNLDETVTRN